jgi:hypothetical protein
MNVHNISNIYNSICSNNNNIHKEVYGLLDYAHGESGNTISYNNVQTTKTIGTN